MVSTVANVKTCSAINQPTPKFRAQFAPLRQNITFNFAATPDTGATRTVIDSKILDRYQINYDRRPEPLYNASQTLMKCEGSIKLQVSIDQGPCVTIDALVSSDLNEEILISWPDMILLGVLSPDFPAVAKPI